MELFPLPGQDTRLIRHKDIVYKIKVVYTADNEGGDPIVPCDVNIAQHEIEEAIRVVLKGYQTPVKTDHFLLYTESKPWKTASLLTFTLNGRSLYTHPSMLTVFVQARTDLATNSTEHQTELPQTRSRKQKYMENVCVASAESPDPNCRYPRKFAFKETPPVSSPSPKKARTSQKRSSSEEKSPSRGDTGHRRYLLRSQPASHALVKNREQQRKTLKCHIKYQDSEGAPYTKTHQTMDAPMTRPRRNPGCSSGSEARAGSRQAPQDSPRDTTQQCDTEPRVGATAGAELRPAYPQGGSVQHDIPVPAHHAGRYDREQYQLNEQMRLQILAGNQPAGLLALEHGHNLRPRGPFQQMVTSVLTPVKKLFS